jgi:hypothetical protein
MDFRATAFQCFSLLPSQKFQAKLQYVRLKNFPSQVIVEVGSQLQCLYRLTVFRDARATGYNRPRYRRRSLHISDNP